MDYLEVCSGYMVYDTNIIYSCISQNLALVCLIWFICKR